MVATFVPRLFRHCGPTTIARIIALIILDSLDGVLRAWTISHVGVKVLEFIPTFAHSEAAPAVMFVVRTIFVAASTEH